MQERPGEHSHLHNIDNRTKNVSFILTTHLAIDHNIHRNQENFIIQADEDLCKVFLKACI